MTPTREHLLSRLTIELESAYYIDGQPNPSHVYCHEHARKVAERWGRARGIQVYVCGAWAGSDGEEWCAIRTCGVALDSGGLTDYGVDSALALTEEDPFASCISPEGLLLAANSMMPGDPRWAVWDRHVLMAVQDTDGRSALCEP